MPSFVSCLVYSQHPSTRTMLASCIIWLLIWRQPREDQWHWINSDSFPSSIQSRRRWTKPSSPSFDCLEALWTSRNEAAPVLNPLYLYHLYVSPPAELLSCYIAYLNEHHSHFQRENRLSINCRFKQALLGGKPASFPQKEGKLSSFPLSAVIMMKRNVSIHYKNGFDSIEGAYLHHGWFLAFYTCFGKQCGAVTLWNAWLVLWLTSASTGIWGY